MLFPVTEALEYCLDRSIKMEFIPATNYRETPEISVFQDVGFRDEQQDRYITCRLDSGLLLAVADGHGGCQTSSLVASHLALIFSEETERVSSDARLSDACVRQVIRKVFRRLDQLTQDMACGSTLTLAFIESGSRRSDFSPAIRITTGQLGDSVFAVSSAPGRLSSAPIHSVRYRKKDVDIIRQQFRDQYNEDCRVSCGYIYSSPARYAALALTRALGDTSFTLIRKPEVKSYIVNTSETILLLATDGILKPEVRPGTTIRQIMRRIRQGQYATEIIQELKPLEDNTTLLIARNFG